MRFVKINTKISVVWLWFLPLWAWAQQDPQFSQFYAAPLYMSPAMAGGSAMPRLMFNYRNQWPGSLATFSTTQVSGDFFSEKYSSGVGLVLMNDNQGTGKLKNNYVTAQYAFQLRLSEDHMIRLGAEGSYLHSALNTNGLTFGDMFFEGDLTRGRGFTGTSSDPLANTKGFFNHFDVGSGILYNSRKFWLGTSFKNIIGQRESYRLANSLVTLPANSLRKLSVHGGVNFVMSNPNLTRLRRAENEDQDIVLTLAANYKKQAASNQMETGAYLYLAPMTLGIWYRGIPTQPRTNDALIGLIGFKQDRFSVGYSYDITVSSLGMGTGGAHELSLRYEFMPPDRYDRMRIKRRKQELSCPKF